jgi:hypothetical protein
MRKLIALISLSLFASLSFANGNSYCNGRPSAQAQQSCYQSAVSQKNMQIKQNYAKITSHPRISAQTRAAMDKDMNDWAAWVNSACRNDVCVYNEVTRRNNELVQYYNQNLK